MTALWVALAGGGGAMARFLADDAISRRTSLRWPMGTLVVNVTGSFALGVLVGLVMFNGGPDRLRSVAGVGFCGGYTTFSTASVETVRLVEQRRWSAAAGYAGASLLLSLLAAGGGLALGSAV